MSIGESAMGLQHRDVDADTDGVVDNTPFVDQWRAREVMRSSPHDEWWRTYAWRLAFTDVVSVMTAVGVAYLIRFDGDGSATVSGEFAPTYLAVSVALTAAWLGALTLGRTRDRRIVGVGGAEYVRVFDATWKLFAAVAIVAYLFRMELARGFLGAAAPLGLMLLLATRYAWRQWLHRKREAGEFTSGILIIGHRHKAAGLIDLFHGNPSAGYAVIGVCVPSGEVRIGERIQGVPVLGSMEDAARVATDIGARAVAVSGSDTITSEAVRRLGWGLEGSGVDLALTLTLLDVAGPRVHLQPVNGLPLMYVDEPAFSGGKYVLKSVFDWLAALVITVLLAPLLLAIAIVVAVATPGGVFYSQERVGKDGRTFRMLKFRSMVAGAHGRLAEVLASEGIDEVSVYYKPRNDPRVTRVGRFLRRYSLDELPQLFNVLRGEMSLVGPRPQIAAEVARYDVAAHRRLLVKPGLTGLWQVSGRSSLGLAESIRLDVNYVENWTLFGDLTILARTMKAMVTSNGAY